MGHGLNLPQFDELIYTSCYCEENVWKLCEYVKDFCSNELINCHAVFVSNENKTVPLYCQKKGEASSGHVVCWDYHVFFVYDNKKQEALVYDFDSILPFPCTFEKYCELTFAGEDRLREEYRRHFRVIPADEYLKNFSSDRSHMLRPDGTYSYPPPKYPPILADNGMHILEDLISMNMERCRIGKVMSCQEFCKAFTT